MVEPEKARRSASKGQTSAILIVLIILIFMGLAVFLIFSSMGDTHDEYQNLYVHNLLLSVLRRNTGYGGYCETVSSTISCAYMTPQRSCGGEPCRNLSMEIVPSLVDRVIKQNYDYCMVVEPESNLNRSMTEESAGISYGNCESVRRKGERWVANEKILQHDADLNIRMFVARK